MARTPISKIETGRDARLLCLMQEMVKAAERSKST